MDERNTTWSTNLSNLLTVLTLGMANTTELSEGISAPKFELPDQTGKVHRLDSYRGRWIVLYFYPKDDTPGCTKEACHFRDDIPQLQALEAQVLGVSVDSVHSHAQFATKYNLPFPLLEDAGGIVAKQYGALWSLGPIKYAKRHTFIIDPTGTIARIYRDVKPEAHSQQVIEDIDALRRLKG